MKFLHNTFIFLLGVFFHNQLLFAQDGAQLFATFCTTCHVEDAQSRAPNLNVLRQLNPEHVLSALEKGSMMKVGAERSRKERIALAEYVTAKSYDPLHHEQIKADAYCRNSSLPNNSPKLENWNSWGGNNENTRHQVASEMGLNLKTVAQLKLKWSFGCPGASSASTQAVVNSGRVYVGSWEGDVFSLDAQTGCIHWRIEAEAGVRAGLLIDETSNSIYFADLAANVYAADAKTGKLLWKSKVDSHPLARISGGLKLNNGLLYIPVSS